MYIINIYIKRYILCLYTRCGNSCFMHAVCWWRATDWRCIIVSVSMECDIHLGLWVTYHAPSLSVSSHLYPNSVGYISYVYDIAHPRTSEGVCMGRLMITCTWYTVYIYYIMLNVYSACVHSLSLVYARQCVRVCLGCSWNDLKVGLGSFQMAWWFYWHCCVVCVGSFSCRFKVVWDVCGECLGMVGYCFNMVLVGQC